MRSSSKVKEESQPEEVVEGSSEPVVIACIPAYNEESRIADIIHKTAKYVSEILVCDDGSTDKTREIASALGVKVIRNEVFMGYSMTMSKLLSEALNIGADYVVTLYADGSHDPSEIPRFIEASKKKGVDIGIGFNSIGSDSGSGDGGVKFLDSLAEARDVISSDSLTDFRLYTGKALSTLDFDGSGVFDRVKVVERARKKGLRIAEIPIQPKPRVESPNPTIPIIEEPTIISDTPIDRILSIIMDHPVLLFVAPGVVALLGSAALYVYALKQFVESSYLSIPAVLFGTSAGTLGLVLLFGGLLLWDKARVKA